MRRLTDICLGGRGDKLALRWIGRDDRIRDFTYAALGAAANRFANVLAQRGVGKGDRVFSLLGRTPELYIAALGTLKNGSVFSPLFSAFGPEPIKARMTHRQRQGAHHLRSVLPPQGRAVAQRASRALSTYF